MEIGSAEFVYNQSYHPMKLGSALNSHFYKDITYSCFAFFNFYTYTYLGGGGYKKEQVYSLPLKSFIIITIYNSIYLNSQISK